ncbi:MAG: DMT family transporter [Bacteroidetes bacterium]|nr:DMT family transporter [Bacteroidota bacterium]MCL5025490.1 DMT family transporter [Chloroflexota bacterium]
MLGNLSAIGSAFTWATGGVLLRSQTRQVDAITLNAMQYGFAAFFFVGVALLAGRLPGVLAAPTASLAWVVGGSMIGMIAGDTLYVQGMARCGLSRAFPITSSLYMLFSYVGAVVLLKEPVGWNAALGGTIIAAGISLITMGRAGQKGNDVAAARIGPREWAGLIGASTFWSIATMMLRVGMLEVDTVSANVVRLPVVAAVLLVASTLHQRGPRFARYGWRPLAATAGAGLIGICGGSMLFLYALQTAGAARASILSSLSPLFAAPMSVVFFQEGVTRVLVLGTLLCVAGTVVITLR